MTTQRRERKTNSFTENIGKLPPQAVDVEIKVLGTLIGNANKIPAHVWGLIKPEIFYNEANLKICEACFALKHELTPIDEITVMNRLRKAGELELVGGAYYLTQLTEKTTFSDLANMEHHLLIVTEKYLGRQLIKLSMEVMASSYEDTSNPLAEISKLANTINDLKNGIFKRTEKKVDEIIDRMEIEMFAPKIDGLIGSSSGFKGLDYVCQGDQENQLIIDAGRPGMAKTAFMCSAMAASSFDTETWELLPKEKQIPVACFSLEMADVQLVFRLVSETSSIPTLTLKKGNLDVTTMQRYRDFKAKLKQAPIFIDDTAGLNIDEFEAKAAILVALHGVKKIYIDYLQLMHGSPYKKYNNRESEVSDISRRLKQCAKNLRITIIASCQLSREVEKRKFCLPVLSDLRESGSIEQDADVVRFLWRPEYYEHVIKELNESHGSIKADLFGLDITDFTGLTFCIVAKCREEKTGKVPLRFQGQIMRVSDHPLVLDKIRNQHQYPQFSPESSEHIAF